MSWLKDQTSLLEEDQKRQVSDPHMTKKLLFLVTFLGVLLLFTQMQALIVECPCCESILEIDLPEARKIPISGDLWRCSTCQNLQVNRLPACVFCGNRIDRD